MRGSLFVATAVVSIVVAASCAEASPVSGACRAALNALDLSWDHQGFGTPTKPAQMRVPGTDGNAISGQAYGYVTEQMRLAAADEQRGDFTDCLKHVQRAQADLPFPATALLARHSVIALAAAGVEMDALDVAYSKFTGAEREAVLHAPTLRLP